MRLERIFEAAIASMITGHHAPHSYHAWVQGKGYVSNGNPHLFDRADYLRQLEQSARSEYENMGHATGYAERGYEVPKHGVLFSNWNWFPSKLTDILERAGYAIEWSDEWTTCENCQRAFRTSPDSYDWTQYGQFIEGDRDHSSAYHSDTVELCLDCLQEWAEQCRQYEIANEIDEAYYRLCCQLQGAFEDSIYYNQ